MRVWIGRLAGLAASGLLLAAPGLAHADCPAFARTVAEHLGITAPVRAPECHLPPALATASRWRIVQVRDRTAGHLELLVAVPGRRPVPVGLRLEVRRWAWRLRRAVPAGGRLRPEDLERTAVWVPYGTRLMVQLPDGVVARIPLRPGAILTARTVLPATLGSVCRLEVRRGAVAVRTRVRLEGVRRDGRVVLGSGRRRWVIDPWDVAWQRRLRCAS